MREIDPIGSWLRDARARRRVGRNAVCACSEARPPALISGRTPPICFRCERLAHGREPYEDNHVFGKANSPLKIRYPINDHRAIFNVKQLDWTDKTLENRHRSLLLEGIARFHGLVDNVAHMLADCLAFVPKLKHVESLLVTIYGPDWLPALEAAAQTAVRRTRKRENGSAAFQCGLRDKAKRLQ